MFLITVVLLVYRNTEDLSSFLWYLCVGFLDVAVWFCTFVPQLHVFYSLQFREVVFKSYCWCERMEVKGGHNWFKEIIHSFSLNVTSQRTFVCTPVEVPACPSGIGGVRQVRGQRPLVTELWVTSRHDILLCKHGGTHPSAPCGGRKHTRQNELVKKSTEGRTDWLLG